MCLGIQCVAITADDTLKNHTSGMLRASMSVAGEICHSCLLITTLTGIGPGSVGTGSRRSHHVSLR